MKRSIILALLLSLLAIPSYSAKKEKPKPGVRVYDANGLDMGILLAHQREWIQVFVGELGLSTTIHKSGGDFIRHSASLYFDDYGCQGTTWTNDVAIVEWFGQLFTGYIPDESGGFEWRYYTVIEAPGNVNYLSWTNGIECFSPYPGSLYGYPLREIPEEEMPPALLNFTLPFSYREN